MGELGRRELDAVKAWVASGCDGPQPRLDAEARRVLADRLAAAMAAWAGSIAMSKVESADSPASRDWRDRFGLMPPERSKRLRRASAVFAAGPTAIRRTFRLAGNTKWSQIGLEPIAIWRMPACPSGDLDGSTKMRTALLLAFILAATTPTLAQNTGPDDGTMKTPHLEGSPENPLKETHSNDRPNDADAKSVDKKGGVGGKNSDNNGG